MQDIAQNPEKIDSQLEKICEEEMCSLDEIIEVWINIPNKNEEMDYLEKACMCFLGISDLVDGNFQKFTPNKRLAKKYRLIAKLLKLKARQLEIDML